MTKFTKEQIQKFGLDTSCIPDEKLENKLNNYVNSRDKVLALNEEDFTTLLNGSEDGKKRFNWNGHYLLLRQKTRTIVKEDFRETNRIFYE